jgi:hypothetical protein
MNPYCQVVVSSCQDYVCPYIIEYVENINICPENCYYDQDFRTCVADVYAEYGEEQCLTLKSECVFDEFTQRCRLLRCSDFGRDGGSCVNNR